MYHGKPEHRATADRRGLRYESDLTEAEWALVAPLIRPAKRGGGPGTVNGREVRNVIFHLSGRDVSGRRCRGPAPRITVRKHPPWEWDGTLERIHHALYVEVRGTQVARQARLRQIIDSQTQTVPAKGDFTRRVRYVARKKVIGRKRHVLTNTISLLLAIHVHPDSVQDRDGARLSSARPNESCPVHQAHQRRRRLSRAKNAGLRRPQRQWELQIVAAATGNFRRAAEKMDRGAHLPLDQPLSSAGTRSERHD